jgi:peptidoglycan/LPS O-acetylase OafA/YrhL
LVVVATHFAMAFYPAAAFGSAYRAHGEGERLFTTTPLGLVLAGQWAVCLFFVLSGYVLSIRFFGPAAKDTNQLLEAVVKRPFRLGGLVLFSVIISVLLVLAGGYLNGAASAETYSIPWFRDLTPPDLIRLKHLAADLTLRLFAAGEKYNSPLWTIETELYGSFVTFGFLLLFRKSRLRWLGYVGAMIYFRGTFYQGFLLGMLLADGMRNFPKAMERIRTSLIVWPLLLAGLYFASWPAYVPKGDLTGTIYGFLPTFTVVKGSYSMLGAGLVFLAVLSSPRLQAVLSGRWFAFCGRLSYSVYVLHFLLLSSFSCWVFLHLHGRFSYNESSWLAAIVSVPVLVLVSYLATVYVDEPATRGANRIAKLWHGSTEGSAGWGGQRAGEARGGSPATDEIVNRERQPAQAKLDGATELSENP